MDDGASPMKAGGPYTMDISGSNKISLKEILVGDVWFCSGQSNMVHQMGIHGVTYAKDIADANYPQIRQFWIPTLTNLQAPQDDLPTGFWKWANPEDVKDFSAVAYFFARALYEKYHVPIGLILLLKQLSRKIKTPLISTVLREMPSLQMQTDRGKSWIKE